MTSVRLFYLLGKRRESPNDGDLRLCFFLLFIMNQIKFCNLCRVFHFVLVGSKLSNGHSPQIHVTRSLLVRMCRGKSHFFQKWPLANVGESGESEQNRLANVDESGESEQNRLANGS